MKFVVDNMYHRLARWLRMFGYDTIYNQDYVDQDYISIAKEENRIILTRDEDMKSRAQKLGLQAVKPNANCKDVDSACRKYIDEKNYGQYFIHSTGHGIGLEVHELPTVSYRSDTKLKENMAITVEPGIYIENKFGIRIEDSLIVKKNPIVMHKFTKDLVTI